MVGTLDRRRDQFLLFSKFAHLYDAGVPLAEALDLPAGMPVFAPDAEERRVGVMLAAIAGYKRDRDLATRAHQSMSSSPRGSRWKAEGRARQMRGGF